jgi:UDP:flavonoid glycosyltransferase YjiC (YdhE family)
VSRRRPRILFVSENVTLAQVVRLVRLAQSLDAERYEIHFACASFDELCFRGTTFARHRIFTLPDALRELDAGRRVYDVGVLERYVREELSLFQRIAPELVIGERNALERAAILADGPRIGAEHVVLDATPAGAPALSGTLEELERRAIE